LTFRFQFRNSPFDAVANFGQGRTIWLGGGLEWEHISFVDLEKEQQQENQENYQEYHEISEYPNDLYWRFYCNSSDYFAYSEDMMLLIQTKRSFIMPLQTDL
jgi:hypothetical protein